MHLCRSRRIATGTPTKQTNDEEDSFVLAASLVISASTVLASGPVVIEEEGQPEVVAETPRSGWIAPVVVGLVIVRAIACDNGDTTTATSSAIR